MIWVLGTVAVAATTWWILRTVRAIRTVGRGPTAELSAYVAHASAVGTIARVLGIVLTFVGILLSRPDEPGPSALQILSALIAALVVIAVLAVGDHRWPEPTGAIRTASLRARGLRDTVPVAEAALAVGATTVLWIVAATVDSSIGPRIAAVALNAAALISAAVVLHSVTSRASLVAIDAGTDLRFRRSTNGRVLRTVASTALVGAAALTGASIVGDRSGSVGEGLLVVALLIVAFPLQGKVDRPDSCGVAAVDPRSADTGRR